MTKEEVLKEITWDEYDMGNCELFVPLFNKKIPFVFFPEHTPKSITEKMMACLNDVLVLETSNLDIIKDLLYEECLFSFQVADYGCEPKENETHLEAHLREFGISNKEDAFTKSHILEIHIAEDNDQFKGRYSEIHMDSATDNLINIIIKNGKIIDYDDDGTYLDSFDKDEQYAKNNRKRILNQ